MAQEGNTKILSTESQEKQPVLTQAEGIQAKTIRQEISDIFGAIGRNDASSHDFLLRVVQPGLAGLMDGSVSTLAPIFATAFATHQSFTAFLVGMAAAT